MRWLFLASLLLSSRAVAEQVESQFGVLLEKGVSFGTGADGVISLTAPAHLNLEWSAFIEEDYRKRWRLRRAELQLTFLLLFQGSGTACIAKCFHQNGGWRSD